MGIFAGIFFMVIGGSLVAHEVWSGLVRQKGASDKSLAGGTIILILGLIMVYASK